MPGDVPTPAPAAAGPPVSGAECADSQPRCSDSLSLHNTCFELASQAMPLDFENPRVQQLLQQHNPSLLLWYLRQTGQKERALLVVRDMLKSVMRMRVIKETVYIYLFFNDLPGAVEFLSYYERGHQHTRGLAGLLRLSARAAAGAEMARAPDEAVGAAELRADDVCANVAFHTAVAQALQTGFHELPFRALFAYHRRVCGRRFPECLRPHLAALEQAFPPAFLDSLSYRAARFLYRHMPNKQPYLAAMIRNNPCARAAYFARYARTTNDLCGAVRNAVAARCPLWALRMAVERGWLLPGMEPAVARRLRVARPFIGHGMPQETSKTPGLFFQVGETAHDPNAKATRGTGPS